MPRQQRSGKVGVAGNFRRTFRPWPFESFVSSTMRGRSMTFECHRATGSKRWRRTDMASIRFASTTNGGSVLPGEMDMRTKSKLSTATELLHNPHPGEILMEEFLKPMQLSQTALANAISVPPRRINEIVLGKRSITADTDLRLARYFRMSDGFFLGLQTDYELMQRRRKMGPQLKAIRPRGAKNSSFPRFPRQRRQYARPAAHTFVEAREVIFLVRRMHAIVVEREADHQRVHAKHALEVSD